MPSVRYYNQTAPFWDFVASLEEQGSTHPFFSRNERAEEPDSDNQNTERPNPWTDGWAGFPFGAMPHRGRHEHGPPHHHHGPPGPPGPHQHHGPPGPPGPHHMGPPNHDMPPPPDHEHDHEAGPSGPRGPPPPFSEKPDHGPEHHGGPMHSDDESAHGPGHHGGPGRHHGPRAHGGPGGHKGRCGGRGRGGWGGRGRGGPFGHPGFGGPMGGFGALANMFQDQLFSGNGDTSAEKNEEGEENFKPEVDVFDTADSYVVHISLPGAKKEDVGVNWDAEKSELNIAGVTYRPGDEKLVESLALDERKVGAFERKVRLGSRANPAQVDVDGISAKLEDGILRVDVPKLDSGYVEIKKVDIE